MTAQVKERPAQSPAYAEGGKTSIDGLGCGTRWQWKGWTAGVVGHTCAACHERFMSGLSFWGQCEVCGAPVCFHCWANGRRLCLYHDGRGPRTAHAHACAGASTTGEKRSPWAFFSDLLNLETEEEKIERCLRTVKKTPVGGYPLSARKVAERQKVPLALVVQAFQRAAREEWRLVVEDDPYREDCFLEVA